MASKDLVLRLVINGSNDGAIKALAGVSNESVKAGKFLEGLTDKLNQLRLAALAVGAGMVGANGIGDLARLADEYTSINARLKLASTSSEDFAKAQAGVFEIAQRNGRELAATGTLYGRIAGPMRDMGKSGEDTLRIVDAVSASLRISGATAAESSSAQIQFSQALAAGRLQGEELNAVLESSPALAKALATAMRVSVGDLKAMGAEGKLTSKIIAEALLSQADSLKERASQMESTIGEAMTRARNAFQNAFGPSASAGAVQVAAGINAIANNMQTLLEVSALAGAGLAAVFGTRLLASIGATVAAKQGLILAEREALAMAVAAAQANVRAAQAEAARTLVTNGLAAAQARLAATEAAAAAIGPSVATRAGGALVGLLGGPLGAIATALTLGITAWQLWGSKGEEAAGKASKSLGELVKEMQEFGANASVQEQVKHYQALAEAIKKAYQEEKQLRAAARERANSDMNVGTAAQADAAADNDPQVVAKRAERVAAEKALQKELNDINQAAANERQGIVKLQVEKQKALNGELVTNEKEALSKRLADNQAAANAVREAWLNTLNEIKAKQAEAAAAPTKAAEKADTLKSRTDNVRMAGMSEDDKAAYQAQQAQAAQEGAIANQTRGRFELIKGYSQQLQGEFSKAKQSFDAAEKDLTLAFNQAEKAGDSGLMDELSTKLVDIEKQRGQIAAGEAQQLEAQAEAQRSKMAEIEGAANNLKNTLSGMEVQVKIDTAMSNLSTLEQKALAVKSALGAATGGDTSKATDGAYTLEPYLPARAYGGPLPGWASHDRADNVIYRGTPGEWVIQRKAVRFWGADFLAAINSMRLPKFADGGQIGGGALSRISMPSLNAGSLGGLGTESRTPLVLDFGSLGKVNASASKDVEAEVTRIFRIASLRFGRR